MKDKFGREINYLRVSITDRCNLRCKYCMPDGIEKKSMSEILTYEEIEMVCKIAAQNGISKIKITGGEPLVRKGSVGFIKRLKKIPGIEQVTLTTNGVLLEEYAVELKNSGVDAINISLDTLDAKMYKEITGQPRLIDVKNGIEKVLSLSIPVKINSVLLKDKNDNQWESLLELAKKSPVDVRFIEMMPIGAGRGYAPISNEELMQKIREKYGEITREDRIHGNGPACYYRIPGFVGSIGFISAIHGKFCESCNRLRLTAEGQLKPCLCYEEAVDLRKSLRCQDESTLEQEIRKAINEKPSAHCFENGNEVSEKRQMAQIGG